MRGVERACKLHPYTVRTDDGSGLLGTERETYVTDLLITLRQHALPIRPAPFNPAAGRDMLM